MEERRRAKRMPIMLSLEILDLYKQDNVLVSNLHAPIEVTDISKTGMGFISESTLPIGYYFDASINLGMTSDTLHCVIKIIRSQPIDDKKTAYGCEFVGMASILSYLFDDYEHNIDDHNNSENNNDVK
ncbi:PilZ domain-containing protein [Lachnospiraceae bacterium MD1]|uniref:PilZ domain-containing protein n=1 Tax=Variimorphobacter saccharofermentans TaxID=2755051 RepID=A0A839K451_9FIRM|nr:PilZ domain-containing protein [Variimorphobacter saccharofermentans]MBB2183809.1 PilZ domain-containing protein [Variimorphobacter saccharofermentans]